MYSASAMKAVLPLVLATGMSMSPGRHAVTTPHNIPVQNVAAVVVSYVAENDFTITTATWVTHSVGVGLGSQTLALVVGGTTVCSFTVACLAAAGTEVAKSCNVDVTEGQTVAWTRSGCATAALGAITYHVSQ